MLLIKDHRQSFVLHTSSSPSAKPQRHGEEPVSFHVTTEGCMQNTGRQRRQYTFRNERSERFCKRTLSLYSESGRRPDNLMGNLWASGAVRHAP